MDLTSTACSSSCTAGFYPDTTTNPNTGICSACDSACTTCTGKEVTTCTGCKDGWFFATQGIHGTTGCVACDASCSKCNGPGTAGCTACKQAPQGSNNGVVSYYNAGVSSSGNAICVAQCQANNPKTWGDSQDYTCKDCSAGCTSCTSGGNCFSCESNGYQMNQASKFLIITYSYHL